MKYARFLLTVLLFAMLKSAVIAQNFGAYDHYPVYTGRDLGLKYSPLKTSFKVWAPKATQVKLRLYQAGDGGQATAVIDMVKGIKGTWVAVVNKDIVNQYYTFQVMQDGKWSLECPDLYAKAVGVNGIRGMVADMASTNPVNWKNDKKPALKSFNDIIIYEMHIRDISIDTNSGIKHKGKFLGLAETGTKKVRKGNQPGSTTSKRLG